MVKMWGTENEKKKLKFDSFTKRNIGNGRESKLVAGVTVLAEILITGVLVVLVVLLVAVESNTVYAIIILPVRT